MLVLVTNVMLEFLSNSASFWYTINITGDPSYDFSLCRRIGFCFENDWFAFLVGVGLGGYDPVSYFTQDKPSKGNESLTAQHEGATYHFSNQGNLDMFNSDPDKYAPAYGGYCAYAMGKGYLADANPETYKIKDGKLLVFFNNFVVNTLNRWNRDEDNLYPSAEANWESKVAFEED